MLAARERKEHKARNAGKGRISLCSVRSFAANQSSPNWWSSLLSFAVS